MIYLNSKPINVTMFPDGTSEIKYIPNLTKILYSVIRWDFEHEDEAMHLVQLRYILKFNNTKAELVLPYLPYVMQHKELALHAFAHFINSLGFYSVKITRGNKLALELINNSSFFEGST